MEGVPAAWEKGRAIPLRLGAEPAPQPSPSGPEPLPLVEGGSPGGDRFPATLEDALRTEPRRCWRSLRRAGRAPHALPGPARLCGAPAASEPRPGRRPGLAPPPRSLPLGGGGGNPHPPTLNDRPVIPSYPRPACLQPSPRGLNPRGPSFLKGLAHTVIYFSCNILTLLIP